MNYSHQKKCSGIFMPSVFREALRSSIYCLIASVFLFIFGCNHDKPYMMAYSGNHGKPYIMDYSYNTEYDGEYVGNILKSNNYGIIQIREENSTTRYYLIGNKIFQVVTEEELPLHINPFFEDIFDNVDEIILYSYRYKENYYISDKQTIDKAIFFLRKKSLNLKTTSVFLIIAKDLNPAGISQALPSYSLVFKLFFRVNKQELLELTCHGKGFTISSYSKISLPALGDHGYLRFQNNELREYLSGIEMKMRNNQADYNHKK